MARNLDRQAIRDELDADPEGLGYAGMTDAEAAEALNEQRVVGTEQVAVSYAEALERAPKAKLLAIEQANRQGTSDNALLMMEMMRYGGRIETAEDTRGRDIIEGLVADGLLTAQEATVFIVWGEREIRRSRAEEVWGGVVITAEDIAEARAL